MAASIEDVARRAGVSIATVSRSLRGLPDVAPATRGRVLEAARELEYVASPFAARLASGRTGTVGVVVPFVSRWFFAETLGAMESILRDAGYDLLLYNLPDEQRRTEFFTELPVRKRVDALMLASLTLTSEEVSALRGLDCPLGIVGVRHDGFLSTRIDDERGAYLATRHLLELGHRRVALIGGNVPDAIQFDAPLLRHHGYRRALTEAGIAPDPQLERVGRYTVPGGERSAAELFALAEPPTAIFAESDEMAYGVLKQARRAGLRIPRDVAVIGFDDHSYAELMDLSTVRQPVAEQAVDVAERLVGAIRSDEPVSVEDHLLPVELIVRGSTDPAASVY